VGQRQEINNGMSGLARQGSVYATIQTMKLRHILLASTLLLAACGKTSDPHAESKGTIAVSLLSLQNPFFKVIGDSIIAEAKKNGYDTLVVSADGDVARQSNQIKDFIVKDVAAIVLSPTDSKAIVTVIQEANAAAIPVFTVDVPCNEPGVKIATQVATDNFGGGKMAAEAMIEALQGQGGKIGVLDMKQVESCILRVKGFKEVLATHNATAARKIEIVSELDCHGANDKGYKATEDMLQAQPDLVGIFAINDPGALGARGAIEKAGRTDKVVIIGFDGQPEGKQAIKEGKIYADPIQFPDKMGAEVVRAFMRYSKGEELPPQMLIPTSLYRKADGVADASLK
jgi:ribose transport system substrate-binding protein